ncbi:hypothetical protein E4T50_14504 [Aureobasidium sp. EXF-12298]|nr:hypothetical protein E4T50_14504 [Aureobasidium sp. EXF-12298]KAI4752884.1 hypothetical protein E4T51_13958 [Aureobasidium sp. EXF-12344]KAI4770000.1 hypothetical protein E4T52_14959 [Aureobasidium sp. EXF-3400]
MRPFSEKSFCKEEAQREREYRTAPFLYDINNRDLPDAISIRLQIEDLRRAIEPVQPKGEDMRVALELQLQELKIAQAVIDDNRAAVQFSMFGSDTERDYQIAFGLAERFHEADAELMTCTSCMSRFSRHQSFRAPCGAHFYCHDCLKDLYEYTIGDESLYPPSCCKHEIKYDDVKAILGEKLVQRYNKKKIEYEIEPKKRTYCCGPNCEAFVPETSIQSEVATCLDCGRRTCTICKEEAHRDDCPEDEDTQSVLELASREGWQRCYNNKCRRVVSLAVGCNHMTCICGAQFCYVCGARWKTCTCPQWNEEWLVEGTNRPRHAGHRLFQPPRAFY